MKRYRASVFKVGGSFFESFYLRTDNFQKNYLSFYLDLIDLETFDGGVERFHSCFFTGRFLFVDFFRFVLKFADVS